MKRRVVNLLAKKSTMKELKRTKRISVSVIGYLAIILLGFLSIQTPEYSFSKNSVQMIEEIEGLAFEIYPEDIDALLESEDEKYVFIDVRSAYDFQKNHIPRAINIPGDEILEKKNMKLFEDLQSDSALIVLYGIDQMEANGPWMILFQLGFSNSKVLLGGYSAYQKINNGFAEVNYFVEEPIEDFAAIIENAEIPQLQNDLYEPEIIIPVERVKNDIEEGGC